MSEIDVTKCPFYYYDKNYHQKENCTMDGSYSMGYSPCTRNCKWYVEQKLQQAMDNYDKLDLLREEQYNKLVDKYKAKEQECEELKRYKNLFIKAKEIYTRTSKTNKQLINENEDLKDTIKKFTCQSECYKNKETKKYKQECEELKEELKMNQNFVRDGSIESTALCKILEKYKQALDEIENVIKSLENENILTFPDLSLQDNVKAIMGQCNSGYKDILDIINKAKEQ